MYTVQYLTLDLKNIQYHQSVTDCVQHLTLDLKKVQYHQSVTVPDAKVQKSKTKPKWTDVYSTLFNYPQRVQSMKPKKKS